MTTGERSSKNEIITFAEPLVWYPVALSFAFTFIFNRSMNLVVVPGCGELVALPFSLPMMAAL